MDAHTMGTRRQRLFIAASLIVIGALVWFVIRQLNPASAPRPTTPQVQLVSTATPSQRKLHVTTMVPGVWVAREEVTLGSPLDGLRVAEVLVESGDRVSLGQVLVRLERTVLDIQARQAEQAVWRAQAELSQANEQFARMQRLLPLGAVSRQDFEATKATMLAAKATLQQHQAAWEEQRTRQEQTEIRAPFAGTITHRAIQVGAIVGFQSTLFRVASDQPPEFLAQISQQFLPELIVGMTAQVSTSGREGAVAGTIRLISTGVDAATGYGQVRITMAAAPPSFIRLGSVGNARLSLTQRHALAVNVSALRYKPLPGQDPAHAQPYVFVVDDGRVKQITVQVGMREDGWVEVLGGLDVDKRVVVSGASLLQDGDVVEEKIIDTVTGIYEERHTMLSHRILKVKVRARLTPWLSLFTGIPV